MFHFEQRADTQISNCITVGVRWGELGAQMEEIVSEMCSPSSYKCKFFIFGLTEVHQDGSYRLIVAAITGERGEGEAEKHTSDL